MEWQLALFIIFASLLIVMVTGLPVAFGFIVVNIIGVCLFWGGVVGLKQLILSMAGSVANFALLPVPLFVLMGEVMYHSGIAPLMMNTISKWLGRLPGRLGLLAVASGTIFATLTGSSMASVAVMGEVLLPEMRKQGYKKPMSLGPILGSGGLAIMIPPSSLAILVGVVGKVSIGKILIAIIIPGLLMAALYSTYIIVRCLLQPSLAPPYEVTRVPVSVKLLDTVKYVLPIGFVVFMVIGIVFLGIATPTEAAATGALSTFILCAVHRRLNWVMAKRCISGSLRITVMMFMIMTGAKAFSEILAFSGATAGLVESTLSLPIVPIGIILVIQAVVVLLGMFMDQLAIILISLPLFMPVIVAMGFNPVWFSTLFLLNMEMATTSPPFGLSLFVMKSVVSADTSMGDVYRAALPFLYCDAVAMGLIFLFPEIALWLPGLMS